MRSVLTLGLAVALVACNSVKREPLPATGDAGRLGEIGKKLGDDDRKLLVGYLMRREMAKAFGGKLLPDEAKTVGEAIEAQRRWASDLTESQRKAEALKAEVEEKRRVVGEQISRTLTVAFVDAQYHPSSFETGQYQDAEAIDFALQNTGAKPIRAVKGEAVFTDTFGDPYLRLNLKAEDALAPGEKKTVSYVWDVNEFSDDGKKLRALDRDKKFRFEPSQIVFADGTTVRAPDRPDD